MRKFAVALIVASLGALLAIAPIDAPPARAAQMLCTSSISPECQPANLPILIELGIISGGGTTASTATATGGVAVAGMTTTGAAATVGIVGAASTFAEGVTGPGALGSKGLHKQVIKTDPDYVDPSGGRVDCSYARTFAALSAAGAQPVAPDCNVAVGPAGGRVLLEYYPYVSEGYYTLRSTVLEQAPGGATSTIRYQLACFSGSGTWSFRGTTTTINLGTAAVGSVLTQTPAPCSAGLSVSGAAVWKTTSTPTGSTAVGIFGANGVEFAAPATTGSINGTLSGSLGCAGPGGAYSVGWSVVVAVAAGDDIEIPTTLCSEGDMATGVEVEFAPSTGGPSVQIVPPTYVEGALAEVPNDYPDCFGPGVGGCRLELFKIGLGGQLESCGSIGQLCIGWAQIPNPSLSYKCFYGPYEIDLNACSAYRAPQVGVLPNVDPETGEWLPVSTPIPTPLPNDTGTGTAPGTGESTDPGSSDCWPSGWGVFNPLAWVYMPVGCALRAAFIPSPTVVATRLGTLTTMWEASTPGTIATAVADMEFTAPTGCNGVAVDMSWLSVGGWDLGTLRFMPACPGDFFAGFASATKIIGYLAFTIGGLVGLTWQIGRIFGYSGVASSRGDD